MYWKIIPRIEIVHAQILSERRWSLSSKIRLLCYSIIGDLPECGELCR